MAGVLIHANYNALSIQITGLEVLLSGGTEIFSPLSVVTNGFLYNEADAWVSGEDCEAVTWVSGDTPQSVTWTPA